METNKVTISTIEFLKKNGIIAKFSDDNCVIINLQKIKNELTNNQDFMLENLKPKYINFVTATRITSLYNYLDCMFNSENNNIQEIVLVKDTFQKPYGSKSVKQYLQIKNINLFPNAEMAFSI